MIVLARIVADAVVRVQPLKKLQRPALTARDAVLVDNVARNDPLGDFQIASFEETLKKITGARHCIALSSGTAALHLALLAAGVQAGDEVLMPSLTFAATANAAIYIGAHPHFVDVNTETLGINPYKLKRHLDDTTRPDATFDDGRRMGLINNKTGRRISAVVPVHLLGLPCDLFALSDQMRAYGNIAVVEDACEALGSYMVDGRVHAGTIGLASALSFNNNKIVTTGGGGALLTDNDVVARGARSLAQAAKIPNERGAWEHDAIGFNYRASNLGCALALGQLHRFDKTLKAKHALMQAYVAALAPYCEVLRCPGANYWLTAVRCKDADEATALLFELRRRGYEARPLFTPLHLQKPWAHFPRQDSLQVSEDLAKHVVCLPSSVRAD